MQFSQIAGGDKVAYIATDPQTNVQFSAEHFIWQYQCNTFSFITYTQNIYISMYVYIYIYYKLHNNFLKVLT